MRAQLENVPDLPALDQLDRAAAVYTRISRRGLPKIEMIGFEIVAGIAVAQMVVVFVGAGDHVAPALQSLIRDHAHVLDAHRTERSRLRAEPLANLLGMRRPDLDSLHRGGEFRFAERGFAAHQRENWFPIRNLHKALALRRLRQSLDFTQEVDPF